MTAALNRVTSDLGALGAIQSRFSTDVSNFQQTRENYESAASRITDVDVADESANLTRRTILQQAAGAILSQANQQPAIAIQLLRG